jgi:multidrug efflux pump subunit AcrB
LHAETDALFEPIAAHSHSEVRLMLREGTAESAGLTWHAMARSVRAALVGEASTIVRHRDGEFSVVVKYPAARLTALRDLGVVVLENAQRHLTPLDRVVTTEQGVGLREIVRVNRRRRDSPLVQRASPTGISSLLGLLALGFLTGGAILVTLRERA